MSVLVRLNRGETNVNFIKWWRRSMIASAVLIIVSIGSMFLQGLNLGIDFKGGVSWEVKAPGVSVDEARTALDAVGEGSAKIQIVGTDTLRVQGPESTVEHEAEVRRALADLAGTDPSNVSVSTVGASWGGDVTRSAIRALVFFFIAILIYLTIRLELRMAVAAIVAVFHDVIISVGVYSVFQFEVTPGTVIAFLTILGFSIYDTIVVDDKIKENERLVGVSGRMSYAQMTSLSMNQVLLRSINTTVVSLLPVISLLVVGAGIMGAVTLEEFSIALLVGLLVGAYSSIYIAAPVLVLLKDREPKNRAINERLTAQGVDISAPVDRVALAAQTAQGTRRTTASVSTPGDRATTSSPGGTASTAGVTGVIPPRPRKKGRRR
jgi:preprotein translocase subunit SecF